jgi:hypothetical protein
LEDASQISTMAERSSRRSVVVAADIEYLFRARF